MTKEKSSKLSDGVDTENMMANEVPKKSTGKSFSLMPGFACERWEDCVRIKTRLMKKAVAARR